MKNYKIIKTGERLYFDEYGECDYSIPKENGIIIKELNESDISNFNFEKFIKEELRETAINMYELEKKSWIENKRVIEVTTYTLEEYDGSFLVNLIDIITI